MNKGKILFLCFFIVFLIVYTMGISLYFKNKIVFSEVHESNNKYSFISPLLACSSDRNYFNHTTTRKNINDYVKSKIKDVSISDISYYVRILDNGSTFGYNYDHKFIPASLVKLPLAISLLSELSVNEINNIVFTTIRPNDVFSGDNIPDKIQVNSEYTLRELLFEMLVNSDNTAAYNLLDYFNKTKSTQTYRTLGLGLVNFSSNTNLDISAKDYATFFRILYNASFLSRTESEEVLEILSQSTYNSGIRYHIPRNIKISNKFGTRQLINGETYLHDCGIVYNDTPYIVCIMTKGRNKLAQEKIIQDISKMVYYELN